MTVFNENLVHQGSDLLAHGMTQVVRVHHPLEQISLHAALSARFLQLSVEVQDVGLERLALTALK